MGSHALTRRHLAPRQRLAAPSLVQWLATWRCPLACPHCLAAAAGPEEELSPAEALALVDQVAELGVAELLVTGGEPLVRPDLPRVIERLAARGVRWTLNTAVMPGPELQPVLRAHPPAFVAVSLDGPEPLHDAFRGRPGAFRGALASLRFFRELGCRTAAGTTVTRLNAGRLAETFQVVASSAAGAWGIHLLVPEGRARTRPDLFPSARELRRVLAFVARTRQVFPVGLADELGYCGDLEPLVRDAPLTCGAGRAQCVVLPDGEVVPCTTTDRSASAGNVRRTSLRALWEHGFPGCGLDVPARCRACEYAPACQGGCWLQRRRGFRCQKAVWNVPAAMRTAAGVAVCLGALQASPAAPDGPAPQASPAASERPDDSRQELANTLDRAIVALYADQLAHQELAQWPHYEFQGPALPAPGDDALRADPGGRCVLAYRNGAVPTGLEERARLVAGCLETPTRSLGLVALSWRMMVEPGFDGPGPAARSAADRSALRTTMALLRETAAAWRREIFAGKLDPYLARGRVPLHYSFQDFKGSPHPHPWLPLARGVAAERWGSAGEALDGFLERHPYAEAMQLRYSLPGGEARGLALLRGRSRTALSESGTLDPFDIVAVPRSAADLKMVLRHEQAAFEIVLPGGAELTYGDLLRLVRDRYGSKAAAPAHPQPTFRLEADVLGAAAVRDLAATEPPAGDEDGAWRIRQARHWMADFWLF